MEMCSNLFYRKKSIIIAVLFSFSSVVFLQAETFRVHKTNLLAVKVNETADEIEAGINDAIAIELPEDMTFVQGIELAIQVPQIVASWHDSVAWSFYNEITPSPSEKIIDYKGTRLGGVGRTFNSLSLNIQVPLKANNSIKKTPYSQYVEDIPEAVNNRLFFRLQIAMKGMPEEIDSAMFKIKATPILINKGCLVLKTEPPNDKEAEPYTVFIDENLVDSSNKKLMLDAGVHNISIVSDFYRNELRTVTIEQAKTTSLNIKFRDIAPTVIITAPSNSVIYFDDKEIENTKQQFAVQQGEHKVRFVIGDYEIVKNITAVNGRSYTVDINIDAAVSESD